MTNTCKHEHVIAECDNCGTRLLYTPLEKVSELQSALTESQKENARYKNLLLDLKESFENPDNRGIHSVKQMCAYLDSWHKLIESALNGGK